MSSSSRDSPAHGDEFHRPVMVKEVLDFLKVGRGLYVDATVGGGGHSEAILEQPGVGYLVGIDLDPEALARARARLGGDARVRLEQGSFADLRRIVMAVPESGQGIAGVLFDLGASLHQLSAPELGFSYNSDAPLDMRFDRTSSIPTARDIIRHSSEAELAGIIREYGEEPFFRRVSRRIYQLRATISTTRELVGAIDAVVPFRFRRKAAMRVFQALRIAVNHELDNLTTGLRQAIELLQPGGRVVVLAYHSLEDRIVKQSFRAAARSRELKILTRKPLRPAPDEVADNRAARSARLRAGERVAADNDAGLPAREAR